MNIKTETKTYEISYANVEAALLHLLHSNRLIPLEYDILEFDLAVPVNGAGNVEFDLTYAVPDKGRTTKKPHLRVVPNETDQPSLFDI